MKHAFGSGFTVGLEEELQLVDPDTLRLAPLASELLERVELPRELVDHEAYAAQLELRSPPCASAPDATAALGRARAAILHAGATPVGVGVHPLGELGDAELVDSPRYREVGDSMRGLIERTPEGALHVHVGMPDAAAAIRAFNGLRAQLPLLIGLAANSPWWFGRDSGLASARWALVRAYPGRGVPPAFESWDHYVESVELLLRSGGPPDYTFIWWDLRPHPRLGTIELRELDAQSSLDDVAALAALTQALAVEATEEPTAAGMPAEAIAWGCFRAARDGLDAEILHEGKLVPLRVAAHATAESLAGRARELGGADALAGLERLLEAGGAAGRRRAAATRGGPEEMLRELIAETAAGTP